jgi:diphthamide synthase (EF-2-diphthine--ammonia ligase)
MTPPIPTLVSWSSGKDSAWSLHRLQQNPAYRITGLLTTLNMEFDRVAMHSTRREILEAQAEAAGLPLHVVPLPWPCSNEDYEAAMRMACDKAVASGVKAIAFGDLFLEDIRRYREERLAGTA